MSIITSIANRFRSRPTEVSPPRKLTRPEALAELASLDSDETREPLKERKAKTSAVVASVKAELQDAQAEDYAAARALLEHDTAMRHRRDVATTRLRDTCDPSIVQAIEELRDLAHQIRGRKPTTERRQVEVAAAVWLMRDVDLDADEREAEALAVESAIAELQELKLCATEGDDLDARIRHVVRKFVK